MVLHLKNILSKAQIVQFQKNLENADWQDGKHTAGNASALQKTNLQLAQTSPLAIELGNFILQILGQREDFMSAVLPAKIYPPMFNCYENGGHFDYHVDNAIRQVPGTPVKIRTDLSMTLFLTAPEKYEGGELIIEDTLGSQSIKLAAGDIIIYPSTTVHKVNPVTKGKRVSAFFWLQSMVKNNEQRQILYQLDRNIQQLRQQLNDDSKVTGLIGCYHNLLRQFSETN